MHWIAADGHFVGKEGEAAHWRELLTRVEAAGVSEISLLGDLFELWLGLEGLESPWQSALFEPLFRLRDAGVHLRYVVGNKDFFVREWNRRRELFAEVVDRGVRLDGPVRLHLEHGDLVNAADRQYRLWRSFSRSWFSRAVMRAWPRRSLQRLALRVAERMKDTNTYHKSYFPEDMLRARARSLEPGPATLVFGHFHVHRTIEEGDKRIVTLPFLGGEWSGILVAPDGNLRVI